LRQDETDKYNFKFAAGKSDTFTEMLMKLLLNIRHRLQKVFESGGTPWRGHSASL